ncbi:hypothetical protein P154DRAFT_573789 [Amniculicola lignicola CBS 123094]|uniref:Uncharacterized protein n=1 Tax=Amniculicola lignicola CBS 123094 TaxID=1392246 RepID=A0A6A5WY49_9PLEO|nr:hypothetical protein P154DRAFT_573789 [Amniculicola lignicola CBS 123094]
MSASKMFKGETLQSLQALSSWAAPHKNSLGLFLALALALPASQAGGSIGPRGLTQQTVISDTGGSFNSFLLLAGVAYYSGVLGPRSSTDLGSDQEDTDDEDLGLKLMFKPTTALSGVWETLKKSLGGYVKVALFIALIFPVSLQPALHCLLFALIWAVGLFAPTTKLYGPLRYGYLESGQQLHQGYDLVSPWLLYVGASLYLFPAVVGLFFPGSVLTLASALLAPTLSLSVVGFASTWYIHTYRAYVAAVANISTLSAAVVSDARAAASHAEVLVRSTRGYEKQLLDLVAVARRDAALAQSLHSTDFFDCATKAWEALEQVTSPAGEGARLVEQAIAFRDNAMSDDDDDDEGRDAQNQMTQDVVQDVMKQLNVAQAAVHNYKNAKDEFAGGRKKAVSSATDATSMAGRMAQATADLEKLHHEVVVGAEKVKCLTESAKEFAVEGEIVKAEQLVEEARVVTEEPSKESLDLLIYAEKAARSILYEHLTKIEDEFSI